MCVVACRSSSQFGAKLNAWSPKRRPRKILNIKTRVARNPQRNTNLVVELSAEDNHLKMKPVEILVRNGVDHDADGDGDGDEGPLIRFRVSHASSLHDFTLPSRTTFGELKKLLAPKTGLAPEDQKLCFRGREKDDTETLHTAGLKDLSKLLLLERPASKEKKMEEARKKDEISKACQAIAEVRAEVDKLSQKVSSLQASVESGVKVAEKEIIISTELLMVQLLKLDSIKAEGEAKILRKNEVRRVQGYVDTLDALKAKNANPIGHVSNSVSVSTKQEIFDSGVGSLPPSSMSSPSPTKITQDWERFE